MDAHYRPRLQHGKEETYSHVPPLYYFTHHYDNGHEGSAKGVIAYTRVADMSKASLHYLYEGHKQF